MNTNNLIQGAATLEVSLDTQQAELLLSYAALLEKWNKAFNLISRRDIGRLYSRHILDSLAGVPLLRGSHVMDLGSGAGLPGIPLAVAKPQMSFYLCDRSHRRCRFLKQVVRTLPLQQVGVWVGDYGKDEFEQDMPTGFDTIVTRGVATALEVWAMVQSNLASGGRLLIYESTRLDIDAEIEEIPKQDGVDITRHKYTVPGLAQTHSILCMERS